MTKERATLPPGCKCQPEDWAGNDGIIPICKGYVESAGDDFCHHCNHDEACHVTDAADTADTVDNRELDESDEGDKSVLQDSVRLLFQRLGEAALENANLKELLADRTRDVEYEYELRIAAEEKLLLAEDTDNGESLSLFGVVLFPDTVDGQELLAHDCGLIGISMLEEKVGMMKKVDKNEM